MEIIISALNELVIVNSASYLSDGRLWWICLPCTVRSEESEIICPVDFFGRNQCRIPCELLFHIYWNSILVGSTVDSHIASTYSSISGFVYFRHLAYISFFHYFRCIDLVLDAVFCFGRLLLLRDCVLGACSLVFLRYILSCFLYPFICLRCLIDRFCRSIHR